MPYPKDPVKLKQFTDSVAASVASYPAAWALYDPIFKAAATAYNEHLATSPGFVKLDWQMAKAISWVETGPVNKHWKDRVMQIGNHGDPGLTRLLTTPHGKMVRPVTYQSLTASQVYTMPEQNIRAGIGYMMLVAAMFGYARVPVVPVGRVDISQERSSLPPKTKSVLAIVGWRPINFELMAAKYNAGDGNYRDKLAFTYSMVTTGNPPAGAN